MSEDKIPNVDIRDIIDSIPERHETGIIERKFDRIPLVFVEGHSWMKIAVTRDYVNCSWSFSESGNVINEGCLLYDNGEIKPVSGIFYAPKFKIPVVKTIWPVLAKKAEEETERIVKRVKYQFNKRFDPNRWLIKYFNHHVRVYNYSNLIRGQTIKFPLEKEVYDLKIVSVPKFELPLQYEVVREIKVGDYNILFNKDVYKFKIYSFGGWAKLVYIKDSSTEVDVRYNITGEESHERFDVRSGDLLLFAQGRGSKADTRLRVRNLKYY
jgi:hypothetical protein